jgi:hypothetical protein
MLRIGKSGVAASPSRRPTGLGPFPDAIQQIWPTSRIPVPANASRRQQTPASQPAISRTIKAPARRTSLLQGRLSGTADRLDQLVRPCARGLSQDRGDGLFWCHGKLLLFAFRHTWVFYYYYFIFYFYSSLLTRLDFDRPSISNRALVVRAFFGHGRGTSSAHGTCTDHDGTHGSRPFCDGVDKWCPRSKEKKREKLQ